MSKIVILDFCGYCGSKLPTGLGRKRVEEQDCPNCGNDVSARGDRIQGEFEVGEANRFKGLRA